MEPSYSTLEVARLIGVHPNTVRMYESWGMIPKPLRKPNGYRVFGQVHIDQFRLARKAFQIEVLQSGLRKRMIDVVKCSAQGFYDEAIAGTEEYLKMLEKEKRNAEEAAEIAAGILRRAEGDTAVFLGRKEASALLGISMDTLRNWEMNGLLRIKRKENGYRVYDGSDLKTLKMIRSLRCANYSLAAILRMIGALSRDESVDIRYEVNHPGTDEDIVSACDRLIDSLDSAGSNATAILRMLHEMKEKY